MLDGTLPAHTKSMHVVHAEVWEPPNIICLVDLDRSQVS